MTSTPARRASAVTRAAAALLHQRVQFIKDLEAAARAERAALAAVDSARDRARQAAAATAEKYRAALAAGWTTGELRELGYGDRRSTGRLRPTGAGVPEG